MPFRFSCLALAIVAAPAWGQPVAPLPTALPFLDLAPSPALAGIGGAGVAVPGAGPYAALVNPALAGLAARDEAAAANGGPGAGDWRAFGDIRLHGGAQSVGFDAGSLGLPATIGAVASWATMAYGNMPVPGSSSTYEPTDRYAALSLAGASRGAIRFAVGATLRNYSTTDRVVIRNGSADASHRRGLTGDIGVAVAADLADLAGSPTITLPAVGPVRPALEVTAGYAQAHIGALMRYSGGSWQALPRTARLGWGAVAGFDITLDRAGALRAVEAEIAMQAESRLVRQEDGGDYDYAPALGDLGFTDALLGSGDAGVTGRRGVRLTLFETVTLSRGWFGGGGFPDSEAHAVELRLAGALKVAARLSGSEVLAGGARRLDLRWTRAVTFAGSVYETPMTGLSVVVRR